MVSTSHHEPTVRTGTANGWQCCALAPLLFRDGTGISTISIAQEQPEEEQVVRCRFCEAAITNAANKIERSGNHLHTFFNPAGVVYEIGCFSVARGCSQYGWSSMEFAWFAEYRWQLAHCSFCNEQLGWFFSSVDDSFYGLIVSRLVG